MCWKKPDQKFWYRTWSGYNADNYWKQCGPGWTPPLPIFTQKSHIPVSGFRFSSLLVARRTGRWDISSCKQGRNGSRNIAVAHSGQWRISVLIITTISECCLSFSLQMQFLQVPCPSDCVPPMNLVYKFDLLIWQLQLEVSLYSWKAHTSKGEILIHCIHFIIPL